MAGIFGLIYPPSLLVSAAVGGGLGSLVGRLRDSGIKGEDFQEISGHMTLGSVAVAALSDASSLVRVEYAMKSMDGKLIVQPIDDAALKELYMEEGSGK